MRGSTLSNCERNFILNAASEFKRLDGRKLDECRACNIYFGTDWGLCYTSLGETRVITQVSCEIQQPKTTRPNEGLLYVNVEISPMAAPYIESGRSSDVNNHLNRFLEKCIKDSKAVDLESLCLVAEEKVWALRVDVNILNHDGNLLQAASISALAALGHFKRPDVTTDGVEITVHDVTERDPIPITLQHHPVCINYALLNKGESVLADPTATEERIADASLAFGVNAYGEVCGLHLGGSALVEPSLILKYSRKAAALSKEIVGKIKEALEKDAEARQAKRPFGLVECVHWDKIKSLSEKRLAIQLSRFRPSLQMMDEEDVDRKVSGGKVIDLGDNCAELVPPEIKSDVIMKDLKSDVGKVEYHSKVEELEPLEVDDVMQSVDEDYGDGGATKWEIDNTVKNQPMEESDSSKSDEEIQEMKGTTKVVENIVVELSGDSEEEEVVILKSEDVDNPTRTSKPGRAKQQHSNNAKEPLRSENAKKNKKKRRRGQKLP